MEVIKFKCSCGNHSTDKTHSHESNYDYRAIVCTVCGRYSDDFGEHPQDDWSKQYIKPKNDWDIRYAKIKNTEKNNKFLTNEEIQSIKVLNFIATHDGVIKSEDEIKYLLQKGIEKFIAKKRQNLVSITETAYPIRIKY